MTHPLIAVAEVVVVGLQLQQQMHLRAVVAVLAGMSKQLSIIHLLLTLILLVQGVLAQLLESVELLEDMGQTV